MSGYGTVAGGFAGATLTSSRYLWVYPDGGDSEKFKVLTDDTYTSNGVGVLQNAPADDGRASVAFSGECTVIAGGVIEPYDYVTNDSNGKTVTWSAGKVKRGIYLPEKAATASTMQDSASNQQIRIVLLPALSAEPGIIRTSATIDFGSIADGDEENSGNLTVTGAEVGDVAVVNCDSLTDGLALFANVTAANTVQVTCLNNSGGAIDQASDTFYIFVIKQ